MNVEIEGVKYRGLLDNGANVSVLWCGSEKWLEDPTLKFFNYPSTVRTANGMTVRILGFVRVKVT